ncbi:hypothetical protein [Candidatus Binatus sp.]|uniref:hypothetical protein n=1 Tax=Candidatus Binatus sp. TaxID=2811406 RepID=UPI003C495CC7
MKARCRADKLLSNGAAPQKIPKLKRVARPGKKLGRPRTPPPKVFSFESTEPAEFPDLALPSDQMAAAAGR